MMTTHGPSPQTRGPSLTNKFTVVIQAGGESRRMGRDKALVPFLGRPMIERVIQRVSPVADEIVITSNAPESLEYLGLPVYVDVMACRGALNGLLTALLVASYPCVAVVACDMVFASPELLAAEFEALLACDADVAVPVTAHGFEPFHGVYRKDTCTPAVRRAIAAGAVKAGAWYPEVRVIEFDREALSAIGLDGPVFVNANTPDELAAAELLARTEEERLALPCAGDTVLAASSNDTAASGCKACEATPLYVEGV